MMEDKEAKMVFNSMVKIKVGTGKRVFFWKDRWIHGFTVGEIAPTIMELVNTCARNTRTVQQALIDNAWSQDVLGSGEHLLCGTHTSGQPLLGARDGGKKRTST